MSEDMSESASPKLANALICICCVLGITKVYDNYASPELKETLSDVYYSVVVGAQASMPTEIITVKPPSEKPVEPKP